MISLWLDDVRPPKEGYTHWVKTAEEAIALLKTGLVEGISLDYDLGDYQLTGYAVAEFIRDGAISGSLPEIRRLRVHSQHLEGRERIKIALRRAKEAWIANRPHEQSE